LAGLKTPEGRKEEKRFRSQGVLISKQKKDRKEGCEAGLAGI
jgi:hypothetical protein